MGWSDTSDVIMDACATAFDDGGWVHRPVGGAPTPVRAIYRDRFEELDPDSGLVVVSDQPRIGVRLAELPAAPRAGSGEVGNDADLFDGRGATWRVWKIERDGEAGATLFLRRL